MENNNNNISKSHTASTCVVKVSFFLQVLHQSKQTHAFQRSQKKIIPFGSIN